MTTTETKIDIKEILLHFLVCALWSTFDSDVDSRKEFLDESYSVSDFNIKSKKKLKSICSEFVKDNKEAILESELSMEQIGHDLWLTINGHGAGFFDRVMSPDNVSKEVVNKLINGAKKFKEVNLYAEKGKVLVDNV